MKNKGSTKELRARINELIYVKELLIHKEADKSVIDEVQQRLTNLITKYSGKGVIIVESTDKRK